MAENVNNVQIFTCDQCGRAFKFKSSLTRHLATHSRVQHYDCYQCGKNFAILQDLREHLISHASEKSCICSVFGNTYKHRQSLRRHATKHNLTAQKFNCPECGKEFDRRDKLEYHKETHCPRQKCEKCDKEVYHLKSHALICRDGRPKQHECAVCGRKFLEKRYLQEHCRCVHSFEERSNIQ